MARKTKTPPESVLEKAIADLEKNAISKLPFYNLQMTKKAKVDTGTRCNASCFFCYYKNSLDAPVKDTSIIKKEIKSLVDAGFTEIELSGGEPTIHPDFIVLLKYIKELGAEPSFLTNAIAIDPKMMQAIYEAGVRDILISIQGLRDQHDKILGSLGAFDHILTVLEWMKHLDMRARVNTVVTDNHKDLPRLWRIIKDSIHTWNLLPLNHWGDADKLKRKPYQEHAEIFNYLLRDRGKQEPWINIRYFPMCFIEEEYRNHVKNYWHHYSDELDWHPFFMSSVDIKRKILNAYKTTDLEYYQEDLENKRAIFFIKDKDCLSCKHFHECDGYKR